MQTFKLLFMCIGFVTTVDISVKVQFRGSAVMTSYRHAETITAKNELELREKLTKTLENALLDKQIDEVTITTEVHHGNKVYSTQVTKFDATTPNGLDDKTLVATTNGNDITKAKFDAKTPNELDDTTFVTTTKGNDITKANFDATTANELVDTTLVTTAKGNDITKAKFDATTPNELDDTTLVAPTNGNDITEANFDATTPNELVDTTLVTTAKGNDITKAKFDATTPNELDDTTFVAPTNGNDITKANFDATTANELVDTTLVTTAKGNDITKAKFDATTPNGLDETTLVTTANGNDINKAKFDATTANELDDTTLVSTTNRSGITEAKFDATTANELDDTTLVSTTNRNGITEAKFDATTANGLNDTTLATTTKRNDITEAKFEATIPNELDETTTFVNTTNGNNITKAVTSYATSSIKEVHDVTIATVLENVFTTRSITSIASTQLFQQATLTVNTEKCGFAYNSKCFRPIVYDKKNVTLSVAEALCKNKLANIYNVTHLNLLKDYLRTMIPDGQKWIGVRTGMTYEDGQLYSTTGQIKSFSTKSWLLLPLPSDASKTSVVVIVRRSAGNEEGIYCFYPYWEYHGAICENEL
ncbi:uncharacterized protein LOC120340076 [Styela clava]